MEIGSNDPLINSNSYFLEKEYKYSGISIDGLDFSERFAQHRPNTKFIRALIDEKQGEAEFFQVLDDSGWENQMSSMHKEALESGKGFKARSTKLPCFPLSDLKEADKRADVILIDVEGHEFSVLESLDWSRQAPDVFVIENNGEFYERDTLVDYMKQKGFDLFARIGISDDIYVAQGQDASAQMQRE